MFGCYCQFVAISSELCSKQVFARLRYFFPCVSFVVVIMDFFWLCSQHKRICFLTTFDTFFEWKISTPGVSLVIATWICRYNVFCGFTWSHQLKACFTWAMHITSFMIRKRSESVNTRHIIISTRGRNFTGLFFQTEGGKWNLAKD